MARLCASWNAVLTTLQPVVTPDEERPLVLYGTAITKADLAPIPDEDLPPGLPPWMRSLDAWAVRRGDDAQAQAATITIHRSRAASPPATLARPLG